MIPAGELALKYGPAEEEKAKTLVKYLAEAFGLTSEDDFVGLYELALVLYGSGIPTAIYDSFKTVALILRQISTYLGQLGADVSAVDRFFGSLRL